MDGRAALEAVALLGSEAMGELYRYTVELRTPDDANVSDSELASVDVRTLVGKELMVGIELPGTGFVPDSGLGVGAGERYVGGLVQSASLTGVEERVGRYEVVLRPWLIEASLNQDSRIFQDKSVKTIIEEVLSAYGKALEWRVNYPYPKLPYQVQYSESDYTFVRRIARFSLGTKPMSAVAHKQATP